MHAYRLERDFAFAIGEIRCDLAELLVDRAEGVDDVRIEMAAAAFAR